MSDVAAVQRLVEKRNQLKTEISKIIVGQNEVIDHILLSIFSGGHALLVVVPGLAKTLMVNTISQALGLDFKRIQFTPGVLLCNGLRLWALRQFQAFLAANAYWVRANSYHFASIVPPRWPSAFPQFAPVDKLGFPVLASGSNCSSQPTAYGGG